MKRIFTAALAVLFSGFAAAASLEEDVQGYIKAFSGERHGHINAAKTIAWMGISDERVFDIVEKNLKDGAAAAVNVRGDRDIMNWYLRALGWSGNPKYLPTLQSFSDDRGYARWARDAAGELPKFQKWNPIISNRATFDAKLSDETNRMMNMLKSGDVELQGHAARHLHNRSMDPAVQEALAEAVRTGYPKGGNDDQVDAIAWMVQTLGSTRNAKYTPLLEEVLAKSGERKIKNSAVRGLKYFR